MKPPTTCNWLHVPQMVRCGKPVVAMIHEAGYCQEHVSKAASMFGEATNNASNNARWTLGQLGQYTDLNGVVHQCRITKLHADDEIIEVTSVVDGKPVTGVYIHRDEFEPSNI